MSAGDLCWCIERLLITIGARHLPQHNGYQQRQVAIRCVNSESGCRGPGISAINPYRMTSAGGPAGHDRRGPLVTFASTRHRSSGSQGVPAGMLRWKRHTAWCARRGRPLRRMRPVWLTTQCRRRERHWRCCLLVSSQSMSRNSTANGGSVFGIAAKHFPDWASTSDRNRLTLISRRAIELGFPVPMCN